MPRHEADEWDIASSVGLTALGVAGGRAIESKRPEALVVDPYADALIAAADADLPTPTRLPHPGYEDDEEFERMWARMATHMGVRSRFFDDFLADGWADGIRQAVILASGLDARAWRLDWPDEAVVFEIDQPKVLAFKDEVLADRGEPRCARHAVAIDLRADWPAAMRAAGFDPTRPTAWLAEGLLPYLPDEAEHALLTAIDELSAPGSRIAVEHVRSVRALLDGDTNHDGDNQTGANQAEDEELARAVKRFGVDLTELLYDNTGRPDPDERLAALGWQTQVNTGDELAERYGRALEGPGSQLGEYQRYVTARLPR